MNKLHITPHTAVHLAPIDNSRRIANKEARYYVENRKEFKGHNLYAVRFYTEGEHTNLYIVYSYGPHWPLFVAEEDIDTGEVQWYANTEKYGTTTSKHHTQCRPYHVQMMELDRLSMLRVAREGIAGLAAKGPFVL